MTDEDARGCTANQDLQEFPTFALDCSFYGGEDGVVFFPISRDYDIETHWLSIDIDSVVAIDEVP